MTRERMTQFLIKFAYVAVILGLIFLGFKYVLPLLMPFLLAFIFLKDKLMGNVSMGGIKE